jgi:RND family efflux transporter MFP subunit
MVTIRTFHSRSRAPIFLGAVICSVTAMTVVGSVVAARVPAVADAVRAIDSTWKGFGRHRSLGSTSEAPPPKPAVQNVRAEGRVVTYPGGEVVVGTESGGTLASLVVEEKTAVKKGDLIAEMQGDERQAALAEARARTRQADVDAWFTGVEARRATGLLQAQAVARQEVDRARHESRSAWARRQAAAAAQKRLDILVTKLRIVSPIDGVVLTRHANAGETLAAGAPLATIADLTRLRVEAEVDEFDVSRVSVGDRAVITAEGYTATWRGHVEDLPDAILPRRIKPLNPGRAADTRVLLAKIAFDEPTPLRLGQRIEVEIALARLNDAQ